jgi:hypothetical protein
MPLMLRWHNPGGIAFTMTISPHAMLPISLDTLRVALTGPTLQSQVSATELYDALKMEMGSGTFILSTYSTDRCS